LEEVAPFISFPLYWVYRLSAPKDAMNAIWTLRQIPAERRMLELLDVEHWDLHDVKEMVIKIIHRYIMRFGKFFRYENIKRNNIRINATFLCHFIDA